MIQIDTFRAEEKVRAALAEANYKEYLEKGKKNTTPPGEEELQELTLSIIDNSSRGAELDKGNISQQVPPKGRGYQGRNRNEVPFLECKRSWQREQEKAS